MRPTVLAKIWRLGPLLNSEVFEIRRFLKCIKLTLKVDLTPLGKRREHVQCYLSKGLAEEPVDRVAEHIVEEDDDLDGQSWSPWSSWSS